MTVGHIACSAQEILLAADGPQILLLIHFQVQIQAQIPAQVQVLIQPHPQVQVLMMGESLLCSPSNAIKSYSWPNYSALSTICTVISDEGSFTQNVFLS